MAPRALRQQPQLVVDRVPVVIAVDQGGVDRAERGEHVEAEPLVEPVAPGKAALVVRRVEGRVRVDDIQRGVGAEVCQHPFGGLTAQRTDLDHASGTCRVEHWCDGDVPQREHGVAPLPDNSPTRTGTRTVAARAIDWHGDGRYRAEARAVAPSGDGGTHSG